MKLKFHVFQRLAYKGTPAGLTISKKKKLPTGDFNITEYVWGRTSLWFVDRDKFDADERQDVFMNLAALQFSSEERNPSGGAERGGEI